jgi:hypothetical protein
MQRMHRARLRLRCRYLIPITALLGLWLSLPLAQQSTRAAPTLSQRVQLFYYAWYGNPSVYGSWVHWPQGSTTPPNSISANFYPQLGAYDSGDPAALDQHMRWVQQTGAGVIIYSWWGQGSYEDRLVRKTMDAANQYGIKVAWHIEPYGGRTAQSTVNDINYIHQQYGSHPAFYRDAAHGNRAPFYIFYSLQAADWTPLEQVKSSSIVFAQTTDLSRVAHFGGIYTYGGMDMTSSWKWLDDYCKANGMLWAPSVQPGYIDDRAVPGNTVPDVDRRNGATYDEQWTKALDRTQTGSPDYITVTSFNEWHEGSMIEPARNNPPAGYGYLTFLGAYGRTDASAELAYIDRTAFWVSRFTGVTPPTPTPTPPAPTPTSGPVNQTPYGGTARALPGVIQAEDFDNGGEGVAYHDVDAGNTGGQYRASDVDLETASDTDGGYNVGWLRAGEWLEYTVNVQTAGTYTLTARVASGASSGSFRIEAGGVDKTGAIAVPNTGGWQSWSDLTRAVSLSAGQQVLRVYVLGNDFNLNWLRLSAASNTTNLALNKPVTASSTVNAAQPASAAADGNQASYWESANNVWPQTLTVDLGASQSVSKVALKLPASWGARNQTITVLGSADNVSYSTIVAATSYTFSPSSANTVTITFAPTSRRYIRLTFSANSGWPAAQVAELEVY